MNTVEANDFPVFKERGRPLDYSFKYNSKLYKYAHLPVPIKRALHSTDINVLPFTWDSNFNAQCRHNIQDAAAVYNLRMLRDMRRKGNISSSSLDDSQNYKFWGWPITREDEEVTPAVLHELLRRHVVFPSKIF